jgi:hypothetical protein
VARSHLFSSPATREEWLMRRGHTRTEIDRKLLEAASLEAAGTVQRDVCRQIGVSVMTLHRWRKRGATATESVHSLLVENRGLRDIAAKVMLDIFALKQSL